MARVYRIGRTHSFAFLIGLCLAVGSAAPAPAGPEPEELARFEDQMRRDTDWAKRRRADHGPDPYRILALPDRDRWVGILRGAAAVVLLGPSGKEIDRAPAPEGTTGLTRTASGEILVSGEGAGSIARYRVEDDTLRRAPDLPVDGVHGIRGVLDRGDRLLALDPIGHAIYAVSRAVTDQGPRHVADCEGPLQIVAAGTYSVANCLLEGSLLVLDSEDRERTRIVHDGPFWSVAALPVDGGILIAAGGVENRPLDRTDGGFGYIDSFLYVYRLAAGTGKAQLLHQRNLSEDGVVTPKWVSVRAEGDEILVETAGYASAGRLALRWPSASLHGEPQATHSPLPPGTTDIAGGLAANPLLDAWVSAASPDDRAIITHDHERSDGSRLGEALFFTTLMAPWNSSEGPRSRFTCETCHHEGYVDGRTHYTGRGDVHATTKPLVGLHGNRPYFSRALDPTMARMVHNEFRVANKKNGRDPWFALPPEHVDWLDIEASEDALSPTRLRRALMEFLMGFEHGPNGATRGRSRFVARERRGAEIFRDRCEGCHAARLVSDGPDTRVPFDAWEENIFSRGTIIWGRDGYEKTGIQPYVHPEGARVPSLRRLHRKRPYFTNGSAADLEAVLAGVPLDPAAQAHVAVPAHPGLPSEDRAALRAFLALL